MSAPVRPEASPRSGFYSRVMRRRAASGIVLSELQQCGPRRFPRHRHADAYFCLLLHGSYEEQLGRRTLTQRPATLIFHPPGTEHADAVGEAGGRFLVLELAERWLDRLVEHAELPTAPVEIGADGLAAALRLHRELRTPGPAAPLMLEGLALELLGALGRRATGEDRRRPAWLDRAVEQLRDSPAEPLSLSRLAAVAGVHPAQLARAFRHFEGCSAGEYRRRLRVAQVWRQLTATDTPLAQLALEAGFADQSHLTRVFRRLTGTTPGALRRRG